MQNIMIFVEGEGDSKAAPVLVRRILHEWYGIFTWNTKAFKVKNISYMLRKFPDIIRYTNSRIDTHAILVLLDSDDTCPIESVCRILSGVHNGTIFVDKPLAIVFAVREFEAWFLASAKHIWRENIPNPESPRDAKGAVRRLLGGEYSPTIHQARLVSQMSLEEAHENSRSFRRLVSAINKLTANVRLSPYITCD